MRKLQFSLILALFAVTFSFAQDISFGATAGFVSGQQNFESGGVEISASESGFYIGGLVDIGITEKFHVQPELSYLAINDFSSLIMPIMAKYYVADKLSLNAGPTLNYVLEDVGDDATKFGLLLGAGAGYDFSDKWFAEARYDFQLNDYYTGDASNTSNKINYLTIGVGYKFN